MILPGMGKYIPSTDESGDYRRGLIKVNYKTIPGLVLPEVVYNIKKKLGQIFEENHNLESMVLKRGQTVGLVMSCVVTQEEQGQIPVACNEVKQRVMGTSNDTDTRIEGASRENAEKAGGKADSVVFRKQKILQNQRRKVSIHS